MHFDAVLTFRWFVVYRLVPSFVSFDRQGVYCEYSVPRAPRGGVPRRRGGRGPGRGGWRGLELVAELAELEQRGVAGGRRQTPRSSHTFEYGTKFLAYL